VILNLKKTEFGYEVIGEKEEKIPPPKISVSKAEKVSSPKDLTNIKVINKEGENLNAGGAPEVTKPAKAKAGPKATGSGAKNLNSKAKPKKSPSIQTDPEGLKRDDEPSTPASGVNETSVQNGEGIEE